jgi:methionyl aminopeptidase
VNRAIRLKKARDIEALARGGSIIGELFRVVASEIVPGVSTGALDHFAEDFIRSHEGAVPIFKGLYGFPGAVCISVNEEVVHGIPSARRVLGEGDIVSIDVGVKLDGWCTDSSFTFPVGEIDGETTELLAVTLESLDLAIEQAVPGKHVGDIGAAVERRVEGTGFRIIRDLCGHGIGREVHEEPQVPNLGRPGLGPRLEVGMVLAIEPMLAVGTEEIRTLEDGWTMVSSDGSRTAHYEHTVAVTADGPVILTAPDPARTPA